MPIPLNAAGDPNRTVHAWLREDGQIAAEVVRYDRSGKFYIEYRDDRPRRQVTLTEAAQACVDHHAHFGRPGGSRFDAKVRALRAAH